MNRLWSEHDAQWRDPSAVVAQWEEASATDPALLRYSVRGEWWETVETEGVCLLVTREYEHLVLCIGVRDGKPHVTYLRVPHPSGLAVDRKGSKVFLASTRNPNQIFEYAPATDPSAGGSRNGLGPSGRPLLPLRSAFYPGSLYIHDIAIISGKLHANAVGQNAVVKFDDAGGARRVWWPKCIEGPDGPRFDRNYIQLNSIGAGKTLKTSFFSASTDVVSSRRPGHRNFAVDRRGVIFSGATREVMARGLTRPHSVRLSRGKVWALDSGYGGFGFAKDGGYEYVARLPGWTRGLCIKGSTAFFGTSRVIPRFRQYAPGLDVDRSICGLHAVDLRTGRLLGSMVWPRGNQIFAVDWVPPSFTSGFPFVVGRRPGDDEKKLFYGFERSELSKNARRR